MRVVSNKRIKKKIGAVTDEAERFEIRRVYNANFGEQHFGGYIMRYVEMTVEEAMKYCNKNDKVLVAVQDLEKENTDIVFVQKRRTDYRDIFRDAKTISSMCDSLIKELSVFTERQDLTNIQPRGLHKIVLLEEKLE